MDCIFHSSSKDSKKKKKKAAPIKSKLSFDLDEDEDETADASSPELTTSSSKVQKRKHKVDEEKGGPVLKKTTKDPNVDTSFLPDREREAKEREEIEALKKAWLEEQEKIKRKGGCSSKVGVCAELYFSTRGIYLDNVQFLGRLRTS
jgi:hypothetical protein